MGQEWAKQCAPLSHCAGGDDSEKKQKKIAELEESLRNQAVEKGDMKKKLKEQMKRMKALQRKKKDNATQKKIVQLKHEKKQVFNNLLAERRNAIKLEDQIEEFKSQIMNMEDNLMTLQQKQKRARPHNTNYPQLIIPPSSRKHDSYGSDSSRSHISEGDTDYSSDDSDDPGNKIIDSVLTTITLDEQFNVDDDVKDLHSWLDKKINWSKRDNVVRLKKNLADLLTKRSQGYRASLAKSYYETYRRRLGADIKGALQKGKALETINGLLMTRSEYDALLIQEYVQDWDILPTADIICCRSMNELKELNEAYKKKCKGNMKKQLQSLAKRENKKTLLKVIGHILDFERKEDTDVDLGDVNKDLEFVLSSSNFKGRNKERLILIFTTNSVQYIKVFRGQFATKSKDSLTMFIDKKLGPKSTAGYFCKTRIQYALNTPKYFAEKIENLGGSFKRNHKKISDVFIQRMEIDLDLIQIAWETNKYGDGKDMSTWIEGKTNKSLSGYFLAKLLENCHRYSQVRKTDSNRRKTKIEEMLMGQH